jgi:acyl-coenzyme A thioesterase PaaI-like protein
MNKQFDMEKYVQKTMIENNEAQKDLINGMMKGEAYNCSHEEQFMTFAFPVQEWQSNRVGVMQGGLVGVAFDITVSALARFFSETNYIPTVSLEMKYLKPIMLGDTLLVKAKAVSLGRRISHFYLEGTSKKTGKTLVTGSAVYLNIDTESPAKAPIENGVLKRILNNSDRF